MKKMLIVLVVMFALLSCHHRINSITTISDAKNYLKSYEDDGGFSQMYKESIQVGDKVVYYFCRNFGLGWTRWGWYCWEYVTDKNGLIIKKREYYIGSPTTQTENDLGFSLFKEQIHRSPSIWWE